MSMIFDSLELLHKDILNILSDYTEYKEEHEFSWPNYVYTDIKFRRAHLDIVDARDTKNLYMLHLCVFPHTKDPAPIFGFDIIAGPKKVTGAFHDFSPTNKNHWMLEWFHDNNKSFKPKKERELPEWARSIFSGNMIAAGNVNSEEELSKILTLVRTNLKFYLSNIGNTDQNDYTKEQNFYCQKQKENPHTPKVMTSLGLDPEEVKTFIQEGLFPEIS
jgi:hypothetical protein